MAQETLFYGSSDELPHPQEFAKTEPVGVRVLRPEVEADIAIAREWDRESAGQEGAINPFDSSSKETMTPDELRIWMTGDERHALRGIFDKDLDVGFAYAYDDPDSRKRLRSLQSRGLILRHAQHREINWWTDRATPEQAQSGVAQTILELFSDHKQKGRDKRNPLVLLFYVEKDDMATDGELAKSLGFKAIAKHMSYDNPAKGGSDTAFMLTSDAFARALPRLRKT